MDLLYSLARDRPRITVLDDSTWLTCVVETTDSNSNKSNYLVVHRLPTVDVVAAEATATPNLIPLEVEGVANCGLGVVRLTKTENYACVRLNHGMATESVAFFPLTAMQSPDAVQPTIPKVEGLSLNPLAQASLDKDRLALVAGDANGAVWMVRERKSSPDAWELRNRFDLPSSGTSQFAVIDGKTAHIAGIASNDDSAKSGWFSARLTLDAGPGEVSYHQVGLSRAVLGVVLDDAGGVLVGWFGNGGKAPVGVTRLTSTHQISWEQELGTSPLSWGGAALARRHDNAVLALTTTLADPSWLPSKEIPYPPVAFEAFVIRGGPTNGPVPASTNIFQGEVPPIGKAHRPPVLAAVGDQRFLIAWASTSGIHWRFLDESGRITDTPQCDDSAQGDCVAADPSCEAKTCTPEGCTSRLAVDGVGCSASGLCQAGVCITSDP
ncbi:MAG: hypothetical protein H6747_15965 [Deltaproteobacteria bacterium]|nr:hypothetical protein [Deltaproteobacteria bacterium]